jgi:hypothetical protein
MRKNMNCNSIPRGTAGHTRTHTRELPIPLVGMGVTVLRLYWDHPLFTSFSSTHPRHSSHCASPFDGQQADMGVHGCTCHAPAIPWISSQCSTFPPCGTALTSSPSFPFDILCSRLVSTFHLRPCCPFLASLSHATLVDNTFLSRE